MGIGQKRDFYQLKELGFDDFKFIKYVIDSSPKQLKSLHSDLVKHFSVVFQLREYIDSIGVNDSILNSKLDIAIHNLEDDLHSDIESMAIKYIESILR